MNWDENFATHETIQELTDEHLETMRRVQFAYTAKYLASCVESYSDSDIDPLPGALDLANVLMLATYDIPDFNIEQLRMHVTHISCEAPCDELLAMLFDNGDHYDEYSDRDMPDTWDCVNPGTIK